MRDNLNSIEMIVHDHLEWEGEEICPDLPELAGRQAVVATVVEVLDVAHLRLRVVSDDLCAVPAPLAGRGGHAVELDWSEDGRAGELAVHPRHALVQPLQREVGRVVGLLQEHVACTQSLSGGH